MNALLLCKIVKQSKKSLHDLVLDVFDLPNVQKCYNLERTKLDLLESDGGFQKLLKRLKIAMPHVKIVTRVSKTENVLRVDIESENQKDVLQVVKQIERYVNKSGG